MLEFKLIVGLIEEGDIFFHTKFQLDTTKITLSLIWYPVPN